MKIDAIYTKFLNINGETFKIEVIYDQEPDDPRAWSNIGKMVCAHKKYRLGDNTAKTGIDLNRTYGEYAGWSDVESHLRSSLGAQVVLPLFLYDHSGITMQTKPFSCSWDSGQVGFIYATAEDIQEAAGNSVPEKDLIEWATKRLESEVETYNKYLTGETYGYVVTTESGGHYDSCYGFYGTPEECMIEADANLRAQVKISA